LILLRAVQSIDGDRYACQFAFGRAWRIYGVCYL